MGFLYANAGAHTHAHRIYYTLSIVQNNASNLHPNIACNRNSLSVFHLPKHLPKESLWTWAGLAPM